MAKIDVAAGSTSVRLPIFIQASTSTQGLGLTGVIATSAGLQAWYYRGTGTAVPITLATSTLDAPYTSGLFVEVNSTATGLQGAYRFDPPDACFATASAVRSCLIGLGGAANMAPCLLEVQLTGWDNKIAIQTSVLAPQVHTGAIIPQVQTASVALVANNVGTATTVLTVDTVRTATLAGAVHTGAIIPQVQTASLAMLVSTASAVLTVDTVRTATLAPAVHTGAIVPIVQTASNLVSGISGTATVILAAGTHVGAVIPVVQTASVVLTANTVGTASGVGPVTLSTGTHVGAVIPTVNITQTNADKTGYALTAPQVLAIASAVGTAAQAEDYPGTGTAPKSLAQMGYAMMQNLNESNIAYDGTGTVATKSVVKLDQTTTAMTFNVAISSSTEPTGVSRAS